MRWYPWYPCARMLAVVVTAGSPAMLHAQTLPSGSDDRVRKLEERLDAMERRHQDELKQRDAENERLRDPRHSPQRATHRGTSEPFHRGRRRGRARACDARWPHPDRHGSYVHDAVAPVAADRPIPDHCRDGRCSTCSMGWTVPDAPELHVAVVDRFAGPCPRLGDAVPPACGRAAVVIARAGCPDVVTRGRGVDVDRRVLRIEFDGLAAEPEPRRSRFHHPCAFPIRATVLMNGAVLRRLA
jgi:hypothetical protein